MLAALTASNPAVTAADLSAADQIAADAQEQWCREFGRLPLHPPFSPYGIYWKRMNQLDGFE